MSESERIMLQRDVAIASTVPGMAGWHGLTPCQTGENAVMGLENWAAFTIVLATLLLIPRPMMLPVVGRATATMRRS